jgi:SAM-dependent methyltransferase
MTTSPFAPLRCPRCDGALTGTSVPECTSCGEPIRVEEGIPILARNWEPLREQVDAAAQVRPNWYLEEQPPEQASPWRHHLRKRREYVQRALGRYIGGGGKVERLLDLGCGDGNNLVWLSAFAEQSYGSDYNLLRLVRARAQNPGATIFAADILSFPAADETFDVIFFNHVIEHIVDDAAALASARRLLKPGGRLVLGTPNEGAWWWQLAYKRDPQSRATTDHVHFYTGDTIAAKMRAAGLTVIETHYLGWGPPDWRLDGRIRKYRFVDDAFSALGRVFIPRQASSLYLLATRA